MSVLYLKVDINVQPIKRNLAFTILGINSMNCFIIFVSVAFVDSKFKVSYRTNNNC